MNSTPPIPEDDQPRNEIDERLRSEVEQQLEQSRERPFSQVLEEWLKVNWESQGDRSPQCPPILRMMLREEDVPLVKRYAGEVGRWVDAFYMFWDSGLFESAAELTDVSDDVRERLCEPRYLDTDASEFHTRARLAKFRLWGRKLPLPPDSQDVELILEHSGREYRCIIFTGPADTEKAELALATHELNERKHFEIVDCVELKSDPKDQIELCQYGGTVFFEGFDNLRAQQRVEILQIINERRLLKTLKTPNETFQDPHKLDTLFILGVDGQHPGLDIIGWSWDESVIGTTGLVHPLPPLIERLEEIPLHVNQELLELGETDLDPARHGLADVLMRFYEEHRPTGEVYGLWNEVRSRVEEFSPETLLAPESEEEEGSEVTSAVPFKAGSGYRTVWRYGKEYHLSRQQALVIEYLHCCYEKDKSSVHEQELFAAIDEDFGEGDIFMKADRKDAVGKTRKISNIFPNKDYRSELIRKEGKGFYSLNI
jgi:hypothetical protein